MWKFLPYDNVSRNAQESLGLHPYQPVSLLASASYVWHIWGHIPFNKESIYFVSLFEEVWPGIERSLEQFLKKTNKTNKKCRPLTPSEIKCSMLIAVVILIQKHQTLTVNISLHCEYFYFSYCKWTLWYYLHTWYILSMNLLLRRYSFECRSFTWVSLQCGISIITFIQMKDVNIMFSLRHYYQFGCFYNI